MVGARTSLKSFYQVLFRYILKRGPFYTVFFKVCFENRSILSSAFYGIFLEKNPFYSVLFKVYFLKRSILSRAF